MKHYLVNEEQLKELARAADNLCWQLEAGGDKEEADARVALKEANDDCRKIEVPEWATHFAEIHPDEPYRTIRDEEIKR